MVGYGFGSRSQLWCQMGGQLWCQLWLEYLWPWEAKSGQLGLWELGVGASCGFGS